MNAPTIEPREIPGIEKAVEILRFRAHDAKARSPLFTAACREVATLLEAEVDAFERFQRLTIKTKPAVQP